MRVNGKHVSRIAAVLLVLSFLSVQASCTSSPRPYEGFEGKIGRTFADSEPWWPAPVQAPKGAPNVIVILVDDMGYSDLGCYGSEIDTPNIDRLAAGGLRYNNYTTVPLCSPTRAALLTGCNAQSVGVGWIANASPGYPGYTGEISENAVTIAEVLQASGYTTMMVGKWHNTYDHHAGPAGPYNSWPTQRGFDRFKGIMEGETSCFHPHRLYDGNTVIEVDEYPDDFHTTDYWTDTAIDWIKELEATAPDKPFFLYLAHNAIHAPVHAKQKELEKYRGRYDEGWNRLREQRYQRQLELGILPKGARLAEFNPGIPRWDDLSEQDKKLYARHMEAYAGFLENLDQNFGRLHDYLEESGQLDNTIIMLTSDNGGAAGGGMTGTTVTASHFNQLPHDLEMDRTKVEHIGTARTWSLYPLGWSTVSNTPFKRYKSFTHGGGRRVPLIVSWPRKIGDKGDIREQFVHVTDIVPTLLEEIGIEHPKTYEGKNIKPIEGTSFAFTLDEPEAPERHIEQYFEMVGHRGYYKDGWYIVTDHKRRTPFDDSEWELYNLRKDFSETENLAAEHPEKVKELAEGFDKAAFKYQVYPLDDRGRERMAALPPHIMKKALRPEPITLYPDTSTVIRTAFIPMEIDRDYNVTAEVHYEEGDEGVIFARGEQGYGYVLYIEDGELALEYNGFGRLTKLPRVKIEPGDLEIVYSFDAVGKRKGKPSLFVNGEKVSEGPLVTTAMGGGHEGVDIGLDRRGPVSWEVYAKHGAFPFTGEIESVTWTAGEFAPDNMFRMLLKRK